MKVPLHTIALSLVFFCVFSSGEDLYINKTAVTSCTTSNPCYLLDPAIWNNQTLPANNDSITLNVPGTYITLNTSLTLNKVVIYQTALILEGSSSISLAFLLVAGSLTMRDHSSIISSNTVIQDAGYFVLMDNSILVQNDIGLALMYESYLFVHGNSKVSMYL
jgi:hypothetical protein